MAAPGAVAERDDMVEDRQWSVAKAFPGLAAAVIIGATSFNSHAGEPSELEALRREIRVLRERDAERQREVDALRRDLERLRSSVGGTPTDVEPEPRDAAPAVTAAPPEADALDHAVAELDPETAASAPRGTSARSDILSRRLGTAQLRLIDIGMGVLWAAGGSTAPDPEIEGLQLGAHDPRQRGFTLQQAEMSLVGAVDPYFRGEAFIIGTTDAVELEEAFLTSTALPWGLQLEAGTFFTEFGITNTQHPHAWHWIDQPVVNSRMFGGEALRGPGFRLGWLTPLPWFSEVHLGMQNPNEGEFTSSFIGDEPVGGRPQVKQNVDDLDDLLYLTRWVNAWDLDDSLTARIGLSALFGPNGTGNSARTYIYGADMLWRWQPSAHFRGWPFVTWQTEVMQREFHADRFVAGTSVTGGEDGDPHGHGLTASVAPQDDHDEENESDLPSTDLGDWGLYTQVLWGVRQPWALGLRYEYATGSGTSLPDGRNQDPLRDDRHRLSPLVIWQPTEFTRFRLQYNFDRARFLDDDEAHSFWFSMEVLYGAHMAHAF